MYLNVGSSIDKIQGCLNLDICPGEGVDIVADARQIPNEDNTFDGVLAIHVLEHFPAWEHLALVEEWRRVTKPGGKIWINCPDLVRCCKFFVENFRGMRHYWYDCIYGTEMGGNLLMRHQSGLTADMLEHLLFQAGYNNLQFFSSGSIEEAGLKYVPYGTNPADHNVCVIGTKCEKPRGKFEQLPYTLEHTFKEVQ